MCLKQAKREAAHGFLSMCRLPPLLPDSRHNLVVHCLMDYRLKRGVFYVQRDSRECLHSQIHLSHSWYVRFQSTAPLFPRSSLVRNIFSPHSDAELSCFPEMQSHFPNFRAVQTYRITPPYSGRLLTISTTLIIGMLLFQINNFAAKRFSEKRNFFRIFKS